MEFTLQKGETIVNMHRHHVFPFIIRLIIITIGFTPLYLIAELINKTSEFNTMYLELIINIFLLLLLIKVTAVYWLDKLYITNLRIIRIKWKNLFHTEIDDLEIKDIDFLKTKSNGILNIIPFLHYGSFEARAGGNFKQLILFKNVGEPVAIKARVAELLPHKKEMLVEEN